MQLISSSYHSEKIFLSSNDRFPNSTVPALHYKGVLYLPAFFAGRAVRLLFEENGWANAWHAGIFEYDHYHSNTYEVLGVIAGHTELELGGTGTTVFLQKGDVLIIPPGVAHRNIGRENQIGCIGAYPGGIQYNIRYGKAGERTQADHDIARVKSPEKNPVFGTPFLESLKHAPVSAVTLR